jgi:GNAT superfamily N-acetyltransferase
VVDALPVRPAQREDARGIFGLSSEMATSYLVEWESFRRSLTMLLDRPGTHLLVAPASDTIEGYLLGFTHPTFFANGPVGWVEEIAVRPDRRRQGIGARLMGAFEDASRIDGCRISALATRRAASFYRVLGYTPSAEYFSKSMSNP